MAIELYEEASPLAYDRSPDVQRFGVSLPELLAVPFKPRDIYFAETERIHRRGANGRVLKKPRVEIIPGARPGTVGWVDWHRFGPSHVYIDFVKVRDDWRGRGAGKQLVELFYAHVLDPNGVENVHWGRIMNEYAWKIYQRMRQQYPNIHHSGHVDF